MSHESQSKIRVLLAEDSFDHGLIIQALLLREGFEVIWVKSGLEAYELLRAGERFSLLITDVMMPGISGFELLIRLKDEKLSLPTVVLTGKQGEEDILRGLQYGALDFISKPFSPSVVLARIKIALGGRAA